MKRIGESSGTSTDKNDGISNEPLNNVMYPVNSFVTLKPDYANLQDNMRKDFWVGKIIDVKVDNSGRAEKLVLDWYVPKHKMILLMSLRRTKGSIYHGFPQLHQNMS